ncbi:MAG: hypothetical protein QGI49_07920 [SAR202 cluster bacterium]|jgi:hypothetical protein|nr:hypothetical protein [SAR202 cluster bacterium]
MLLLAAAIIAMVLMSALAESPARVEAATLTLSSLGNTGAGTLRQTITDANPGDTINFSVTETITLSSSRLTVLDDLTIAGPGASSFTISGNNSSLVFLTAIGTVAISGCTLTNVNGGGGHGGGGENQGTLRLNYVAVSNSVARLGRGVFNGGTTNRTDRTPIILQFSVRSLGSATTGEDIAHSRHRDDVRPANSTGSP